VLLLANFAVDAEHGWNAGNAARKSKCVRDGMRLRKENMSVRRTLSSISMIAKQSDGDVRTDGELLRSLPTCL
jgi:hypothetical protein